MSHTNFYEAISVAKIFHELGYQVDIVHYESEGVDVVDYDVIFGFGEAFKTAFENPYVCDQKTICYGTGMHVNIQNTNTLRRVKEVYKKRRCWLGKSARFVEKTWTHQTMLVNGIIALGDESCKKSYELFYDGPVFSVPTPFYKTLDANSLIENRRDNSRRRFLWFGSSGLIHKGLDLCLEYFKMRPDLELHICGDISTEPDFEREFSNELYCTKNIFAHGFIDIQSSLFEKILLDCLFVIYPSCSEGGSASVLTAVGNGGLIPIVSRETAVSTGYEIPIKELSVDGISSAIDNALSLDDEKLMFLQKKNFEYVLNNNSQKNYYLSLKSAIGRLLV